MKIQLTEDEFMSVVNAVNVAKHYYEQQNMPEEATNYEHLADLFMVAPSMSVEVSQGLTESSQQLLKEVMARRDKKQDTSPNVIQFPSGV